MKHILILLLVSILLGTGTEAAENDGRLPETEESVWSLEDYDFGELQAFLNQNFDEEVPEFEELAQSLINGDFSSFLETIGRFLRELLVGEIQKNRLALVRVLLLAISAALFSNIASVFRDNQISQNAWFVIYLMLSQTLLSVFGSCYETCLLYLDRLLTFVKLLIPAFSIALSCVCGAAAMSIWYQLTFLLITLIDWVFLYLLLPGIKIYVCLSLLNELTMEDYLSGFLELLRMLAEWILKTITGIVVGMQVIQGLILPAASQSAGTLINKLIQAVPGIGSGIRSASELMIGTGVLIKNGIGAAGVLVIAVICLIPVTQFCVIVVMYYGAGAIIQPVADERIKNCMTQTAYGIRMLMKVIAIAAFLFAVSVALICVFTSRVF